MILERFLTIFRRFLIDLGPKSGSKRLRRSALRMMFSGTILPSVWKSMATVAHIGKRFRFHFQHDRRIDSGFGLRFDGHGGAHREAIWVPMATVAHIGERFGNRVSIRFGNRWPRWRTVGSDFGSISNTAVRSILVSIWVPMATVAHIGKRFGFDLRFHFACDVGGDPRPT